MLCQFTDTVVDIHSESPSTGRVLHCGIHMHLVHVHNGYKKLPRYALSTHPISLYPIPIAPP